ncbi:MAG: ATP-dependent RNA helicase DbpA [Gammaproteobacteria bacterium]|nr:ATP-dependent RNA helicase DbpA [Gammaproteobacteria bacterium]
MNLDFSSLTLSPAMLSNLESLGYAQMTPIQAQSLPQVLAGKDLLAQAKTGSGKTAAFGIGLINKLNQRFFGTQGLVLCPTRELADQVTKELRRLARATQNIKLVTLCGGVPIGPQIGSLQHGAHVVVGTPGRILKHLNKGTLDLSQISTLVLDEADRMLDMGFSDEIDAIIEALPAAGKGGRQTLLFSATYPESMAELCGHVLHQPVEVRIEATHSIEHISQQFYEVPKEQRNATLVSLLIQHQPESAIIFCNTRQQTQTLADELDAMGFYARALHGDLEQRERDRVWTQFANRSVSILVATDVAARGLDIKELDMVVNFELSHDPEVHIHRIGRTGRAGQTGLALSLFSTNEVKRLMAIEEYQGQAIKPQKLDRLSKPEAGFKLTPPMATLQIDGGRKQKVRPGDILGALTGDKGITGKQVGKIDLFDNTAYVAIERAAAKQALNLLNTGKIKGRKFRVRQLH